MPEINSPEHSSRLSEIEELEKQLAEKKASINIEGSIGHMEKRVEISRENAAETQTQVAAPAQAPATAKQNDAKRLEIANDAKSIALMDESRKIQTLVALALEKGISHSIDVANSLRDPYILDMLHDKLIGELHDRLVKENKLKEL